MNQKAMEQKAKEIAKEYTDLKRDLAALEKQTQEIEENRESIRVELETSDKREAKSGLIKIRKNWMRRKSRKTLIQRN